MCAYRSRSTFSMRLDDGDNGDDDDGDDEDDDGKLVWRERTDVGSIDNPTESMTGTTAAKNEGRSRGERRWKFDERLGLTVRSASYLLRSRFREH